MKIANTKRKSWIDFQIIYYSHITKHLPIKCKCGWGFSHKKSLDKHQRSYGHLNSKKIKTIKPKAKPKIINKISIPEIKSP